MREVFPFDTMETSIQLADILHQVHVLELSFWLLPTAPAAYLVPPAHPPHSTPWQVELTHNLEMMYVLM